VFEDPIKPDVLETIGRFRGLGVTLKIVTGDNRLVAAQCRTGDRLVEWKYLDRRGFAADERRSAVSRVNDVHVFAEVEPNQKERIILALKKAGHVVGYGGDASNDAFGIARGGCRRVRRARGWTLQKKRRISCCWKRILASC